MNPRLRIWVHAAALLLLGAAGAYGIQRLEVDNTASVFYRDDPNATAAHAQYSAVFDAERLLRITWSGVKLQSEHWRTLEHTAERLRATAGVSAVYSPVDVYRLRKGPAQDAPDDFAAVVTTSELAQALGFHREVGWVLALRAPSATGAHGAAEERRRLAAIEAALPSTVRAQAQLVGQPALSRALDAAALEVGSRIVPWLLAMAALLMGLRTRSLSATLVALAYVALCELVVMGCLGFMGVRMNMVLSVLPPVIFALALATASHVLHAYADAEGSRRARIAEAFTRKRRPLIWAGVTTAIGFLALTTSDVRAVRQLGVWAGVSAGVITALAFLALPLLLRAVEPTRLFPFAPRVQGLTAWALRHRPMTFAVAGCVAIAACAGALGLRQETNAVNYLAPDHPLRRAMRQADAEGVGVAHVETHLRLSAPDCAEADGLDALLAEPCAFRSDARLQQLVALERRVREIPGVHGVVSAGALLRELASQQTQADSLLPTAALLSAASLLRDSAMLDAFVSPDGRDARMTVLVSLQDAAALDTLKTRLGEAIGPLITPLGAHFSFTGTYVRLLDAQRYLLRTLSRSLGLTALCMLLIVALLTRKLRQSLAAMAANLWPVLGMLGIMGALRIPLDISTAMVASIALGLAVDDSLHTLSEAHPPLSAERLRDVLAGTGPAYVTSTLALATGFSMCLLSSFAPTARFGGLATLALALALLSDLTLLPALLLGRRRGT